MLGTREEKSEGSLTDARRSGGQVLAKVQRENA
jgi:hypothetical protein